ncbi:hypothetical protein [Alteromonas sp. ASW11-130]|uniref:hypothetical protein n=1 Tax=Alteromonas sp. ASW11-130 TaxID=3015775 RepID=UPI002241D487|nr:hypothetical protein [Alteromonas sp. ASW11-130]MCW8091919.1 hypothetical protein [Alteromonas sp. ASW11-130]
MLTPRYLIARYTTLSIGIACFSHLSLWIVTETPPSWLFTILIINLVWFLSFKEVVLILTAVGQDSSTNRVEEKY